MVVEQTNLYAQRQQEAGPTGRPWKPITIQELILWVGICIAMSMCTQPNVEMYWWKGGRGAMTFPDFGRLGMGLTRWQQIKRYFHLNDNSARPIDKTTRAYRLWHCLPFINLLKETFKTYWRLGKKLTADERTVPSRHRQNPIRIYNKSKPYKFGMELFTLCCSMTYYCWDFVVYDRIKQVGLHSLVVMDMVRTLTMRGHTIFLDRGFTSPALVRWLGNRGHGATGTVMSNRKGFPKDLTLPKNAPKGTLKAAVTVIGKMLAVAWQDKNVVFFLSNCHKALIGTAQRRVGPDMVDVDCPEVALAYNNHKDAVDQYDKSCLAENKSLEQGLVGWKWWHRLWWGLFDGAIVNAFIIWKHFHPEPEATRTEFMIQLQEEMIKNTLDCGVTATRTRATPQSPGRHDNRRLDQKNHFVKRHPQGLSRACKYCCLKFRGTGTRIPRPMTICSKCGVHLCTDDDCFEKFHLVQDPFLDKKPKGSHKKKKAARQE